MLVTVYLIDMEHESHAETYRDLSRVKGVIDDPRLVDEVLEFVQRHGDLLPRLLDLASVLIKEELE